MNAITTQENHALATTPAQFSGPMGSAIAALQAGMSIEQMQGIMSLQKDWEANEARKAYVADMSEFKRNPPEIYKDKQVAFAGTAYSHATLGGVAKAIVDALARHGFSHSWETKQANGLITVTCKITHRLGHSESTTMEAAPDNSGKKNAIQQVASSITYMQRYTLLAACGLATMDMPDDDGRGGDATRDLEYNQVAMLELWTSLVGDANSLEVLSSTRRSAIAAFKKHDDVNGWEDIKVLIAEKRAVLEASAASTKVSA